MDEHQAGWLREVRQAQSLVDAVHLTRLYLLQSDAAEDVSKLLIEAVQLQFDQIATAHLRQMHLLRQSLEQHEELVRQLIAMAPGPKSTTTPPPTEAEEP